MSCLKSYIYLASVPFFFFACQGVASQLSPSTVVQANINLLVETKSCPQCDLSGAQLTRLDLSGANLEGADLSRAKMSLTNLSGANLQKADLREAIFYGADLANADLRGADLTGASLDGAYINSALMDGELVTTTPYNHDAINDVEETVYVEDTVNSKIPQETEEISIGSRRDFEETPPVVPEGIMQIESVQSTSPRTPVENVTLSYGEESLPKQSAAAPTAKATPAIQEVRIDEEVVEVVENEVLLREKSKKQLSTENLPDSVVQEQDGKTDAIVSTDKFTKTGQTQRVNEMPQDIPSGTDSVPVVALNTDQGKSNEVEQSENVNETGDGSLVEVTTVEDSGVADKAMEMVQSVLNVFSKDAPSTEVMKNVVLLLDVNQCYGCNLTGVDLSGENLDSADLEGANLSNAILKDVDLEGANLKGANLTGADLSGADLSEADMYKAILTDADLTDADLEGALLDDVDLSGVKGYKKQAMMLMEQN